MSSIPNKCILDSCPASAYGRVAIDTWPTWARPSPNQRAMFEGSVGRPCLFWRPTRDHRPSGTAWSRWDVCACQTAHSRADRPAFLPPIHPPQATSMGHPHHRATGAAVSGRWARALGGLSKMWILWLVLLLLGQLTWSVDAGDGPGGRPCTLSLAATANRKTARPGRTLKLTVKWSNQGSAGFVGGVFQLQLPPHTEFKGASARFQKGWGASQKPAYDPNTNTVTWARLAVPVKAALTFTVRTKVAKCYPGPQLLFKATAYVLDPNAGADPAPLCTQEDVIVVVGGQPASAQRTVRVDVCAHPSKPPQSPAAGEARPPDARLCTHTGPDDAPHVRRGDLLAHAAADPRAGELVWCFALASSRRFKAHEHHFLLTL